MQLHQEMLQVLMGLFRGDIVMLDEMIGYFVCLFLFRDEFPDRRSYFI